MPHVLKKGKDLTEWKQAHTPKRCPLCNRLMSTVESRNRTVDHDHKTGQVRGILCRNCNGLEGKIHNLCTRAGLHIDDVDWLLNIIQYWQTWDKDTDVYYPGTTFVRGKAVPPKKTRRKRRN